MSSCLSNLSVYLPFSAEKNTPSKPLHFTRLSPFLRPMCRDHYRSIKAIAGGGQGREDLDHLQRSNKRPQPTQPKKRIPAQVPPIGLWDRFPTARTVQQMMETMERMIEDPFAYSGTWPSGVPREDVGGGYRRGRTPWEIKEGEEEYKMRFDMPGMTKKDVKVWVEDKMLVVKAEKKNNTESKEEEEEEEEEWSSKSYGSYSSRIALPENVEFGKIKAEVKDGVLYIIIPKAIVSNKTLDIVVQ